MILRVSSFLVFLILISSSTLGDISGKVISIADGDTITILKSQQEIKIRLNGIDCPEKGQAFGQNAKDYTSKLCFGTIVKVETFGQDRYGRTIGDVHLQDGRILNHELVKAGLAWHYKKYSSDTALSRLELEARAKKIGLWSDPNPVAPWEFRKLK